MTPRRAPVPGASGEPTTSARAILFVIFAASTYAWWPVFGLPYVGDDFEIIRSVAARGPFGMWVNDSTGLFRPIASASAWVDVAAFRTSPTLAHAHSFALYLASTALVWSLARQLGVKRPAFAALLFYSLANHIEPVAWFAARADLLATTFFLSSLLLCLRQGSLSSVGCLLAGTLALLSKESAILLGPVAGVLCLSRRQPLTRPAALTALGAAYLWIRHSFLGSWVGGYGVTALPTPSLGTLTRISEFLTSCFALPAAPWASALCVSMAAACAVEGWRRAMYLFGAFILMALPAAGMQGTLESGEAGRLYFLPSAIACVALTSLLDRVRLGSLVLVAIIVAQLNLLPARAEQWRAAGHVVEQFLDKLAASPSHANRSLAVPGWIGPVCALCTGVDAAGFLRQGPSWQRVYAVARYRAQTPDCQPTPYEQRRDVSIRLPECGLWVEPQEHVEGLELVIDGRDLHIRGTGTLLVEGPSELIPLVPSSR